MIRAAIMSDVADIRACARLAYARYVADIGQKPAPMTADFEAQIAAGQVWVAEDASGGFQGFAVCHHDGDRMLLENVAVLPVCAGQGIGKRLIRHCEDMARGLGLGSVHLYTNEKMAENLAIYPKLGYLETDRRAEDGFNRVYFEKSLR